MLASFRSLILVLLLAATAAADPSARNRFSYSILEGSKLAVIVSTNVNTVECISRESLPTGIVNMFPEGDGRTIRFADTFFRLSARNLDCDNERMNTDLRELLEAEKYPYITLEFESASIDSGSLDARVGESIRVRADIAITIRDSRRSATMILRAARTNSGTYELRAVQELRLTDFGITPPTAFFGLIKVRDLIQITFNVSAHVVRM